MDLDPELLRYRRQRHRARTTGDPVFSQLIPYIGNKRKLLPLIAEGIQRTGSRPGWFVDLFTGSTVVARLAKRLGWSVLANDWEPYAFELARGTVVPDRPPPYAALGGVDAAFAALQAARPRTGWVTRTLCPASDADPDPERERMFFTRRNGRRIDAMRATVQRWEEDGLIDPVGRSHVVAALLYAVCYVSNTSGVFKAYHNGWGGRTGTALYRILSDIELHPPPLIAGRGRQRALRADAAEVAGDLESLCGGVPELVYLDPPYNQHPYGSNYHLLNSIALWDRPRTGPVWRDGRSVDKAAIRKDWRTERRSAYNHRTRALPALTDLLDRLRCSWLLVSYSTDGLMDLPAMLEALADTGRLEILTTTYKRYRVSPTRPSPRPRTVEFLAIVERRRRSAPGTARRALQRLEDEAVVLPG